MIRRSRPLALCGALLALSTAIAPAAEGQPPLRSLRYLPEDAVWVLSIRVDSLATPYDAVLKLVGEFAPAGEIDQVMAPLREWEAEVGVSLRDDLLGVLGEELAFSVGFDDLDRIATAATAAAQGAPLDVEGILGDIVAVVGVQDAEHFDRSLARLVGSLGGRLGRTENGTRVMQFLHQGQELSLLHYRYHEGFAVFGFGDGPITDAILRTDTGHNVLASGAYQEVFRHLDPDPQSVTFLNLPRVRRLLLDSDLVQMAVSQDPTARRYFQRFVVDLDWRAGMGWASYPVEGGAVQQSFAPFDMGTFASSYMGIVAAVAVPNFLDAMDRGRQKRTVADLQSIGTALEAYASDHGTYPPGVTDPTPVGGHGEANLERWLVPMYVAQIPSTDAWGNPFVYRSDPDGMTYLLSSYGKDGEPTADEEAGQYEADIHYANGMFLSGLVEP